MFSLSINVLLARIKMKLFVKKKMLLRTEELNFLKKVWNQTFSVLTTRTHETIWRINHNYISWTRPVSINLITVITQDTFSNNRRNQSMPRKVWNRREFTNLQEFLYMDMSTWTLAHYHAVVCTDNIINQLLVWLFLRNKNHDSSKKKINVSFILLRI